MRLRASTSCTSWDEKKYAALGKQKDTNCAACLPLCVCVVCVSVCVVCVCVCFFIVVLLFLIFLLLFRDKTKQ